MPARLRLVGLALVLAALGAAFVVPAGAKHGAKYFPLEVLPAPTVTGKEMVDRLEQFERDYPYRHTATPNDLLAADYFRAQAAGMGYDARIEKVAVAPSVPDTASPLQAVVATKRGTTLPDEWILFVGHYDTVPQTVTGTYDNGSGSNMILFLAKALANVPTNRSLMFVWYNGEENGVLTSQRHATELKGAGTKITAVLGFDMVGIAYPVATPDANSCLCLFHGVTSGEAAAAKPLLEYVNFEFLGFPAGSRDVRYVGQNTRNSDERSFAAQGYRTFRWAGRATAASYSQYHGALDNLTTMITEAGGREYLQQGSENTLRSAYYTALSVDNNAPVPRVTTAVEGATLTASAAGSSDADGALGAVMWDFGDGASATGVDAVHTYAQPGEYTVTLSVADNLWPSVRRAVSSRVVVG